MSTCFASRTLAISPMRTFFLFPDKLLFLEISSAREVSTILRVLTTLNLFCHPSNCMSANGNTSASNPAQIPILPHTTSSDSPCLCEWHHHPPEAKAEARQAPPAPSSLSLPCPTTTKSSHLPVGWLTAPPLAHEPVPLHWSEHPTTTS